MDAEEKENMLYSINQIAEMNHVSSDAVRKRLRQGDFEGRITIIDGRSFISEAFIPQGKPRGAKKGCKFPNRKPPRTIAEKKHELAIKAKQEQIISRKGAKKVYSEAEKDSKILEDEADTAYLKTFTLENL